MTSLSGTILIMDRKEVVISAEFIEESCQHLKKSANDEKLTDEYMKQVIEVDIKLIQNGIKALRKELK